MHSFMFTSEAGTGDLATLTPLTVYGASLHAIVSGKNRVSIEGMRAINISKAVTSRTTTTEGGPGLCVTAEGDDRVVRLRHDKPCFGSNDFEYVLLGDDGRFFLLVLAVYVCAGGNTISSFRPSIRGTKSLNIFFV